LISLELTEPCLTRERVDGQGVRVVGVDPARFGSDRTALVLRHGRVVEQVAVYAKLDTMQTVGRVVEQAHRWHGAVLAVDAVGLGAGIYDRLRELRREGQLACEVVAVDVTRAAPRPRRGEPRPK